MSDTPNNHGIIGLAVLLLLLGGKSGGIGKSGGYGGAGILGGLSGLEKNLRLGDFAKDMHRIVAMMDQVEGLTQMAGLSQLAASAGSGSRIGGAANSVSNAFADTFDNLSGQDINQLMEMAGPLMAMLGSQNGNK